VKESRLDPRRFGRTEPILCSVPRLSAKARRSRAAGIGPVSGTEVRVLLASVPTIVVVAGQTQVHAAKIDGAGATPVPRMVSHPFRGGHPRHKLESGEEIFPLLRTRVDARL